MSKLNILGEVYGKLTVISELPCVNYRRKFNCLCLCGRQTEVTMSHLRTGHTISCGCHQKENPNRLLHGHTKKGLRTSLYHVWDQMLSRCRNPKSTAYSKYGAKGVSVCNTWEQFIEFRDWALNNGYQEGLSIERLDAYGNYEPNNCIWIPMSKQGINKRISGLNTSGYTGVSFHIRKQKWLSRITVEGARINLGAFDTAEEANAARVRYIEDNSLNEHRDAYLNQRKNS